MGDEVASLPSRQQSRVKAIYGPDGEVDEGFSPMALTVTLEDEIDASRGDMLVPVIAAMGMSAYERKLDMPNSPSGVS